MKKTLFVLITLLLLFRTAHATTTKYSSGGIYGILTVKTVFTDPYPVEPGGNLVLSIEFKNSGTEMTRDMEVELKPDFPFTLLESSKKTISKIDPNKGTIVEYDLFVDNSATSALYKIPVEFSYKTDSTSTTQKGEVEVRIQGVPELKLLDMSSKTGLEPGNQATIFTRIKNVGTGKANRVTVTFSSTSDYIQPVFSKGVVYIGEVYSNQEKEVNFEIVTDPDAEYSVYAGTVDISYEDESGNELSEEFNVGILVKGKPELQIIKTEIDKTDNELTIELVNIGSAKAVGIKTELIIDDTVFDVDYITQIKIDKRAILRYKMPSGSVTNGDLKLVYEGPDNEEYSQTETITWIRTYSISKWILLVGVTVVGFVVWKKPWRKFRKKK